MPLRKWFPSCSRRALPARSALLLLPPGGVAAVAGPAHAQDYPQHPVRLIVPFPAGGSADAVGRLIAEMLGRHLGQQVVVDNRGGAAGVIGTRQAAESRPDGYTLVLSTPSTFAILPALRDGLPFDARRGFTPIALIGRGPFVLAVAADSPLRSVADLVARSRGQPGTVNFGSAGIGTTPHLVAELFARQTGASLTHVPFRGGAAAVTALLGGQLTMVSAFVSEVLPLAAEGRLRILAVTGEERHPELPAVPTMRESGVDLVLYAWFGLHAPAGVPEAIVARLHRAAQAGLAEPDTARRLAQISIQPATGVGPAELAAMQAREMQTYASLRGVVNLE